jgi:uncharacterized lipoprotein YajG
MSRAAGIALLALAACACGKTAPGSAAPAPAPPAQVADAAPRTLANALDIGSQDARDDLYCSGVIFFRYAPTSDALSPTDEAIRMRNEGMGMVIAQHGADKLMAQGVARVTQLGELSDAYAERTARDMRAGKPRIGLDACMKRAEAVPKPAQ